MDGTLIEALASHKSYRPKDEDGPPGGGGRTTRHPGYATSQTSRKRIEECFGWAKTIGSLRKSRFIGREKLDFQFVMTFAAYSLIRMRNMGVVSC